MNGIAHSVMNINIEFGKYRSVEDTCFEYVPHNSGLYYALNELLMVFSLGHSPGAVAAVN